MDRINWWNYFPVKNNEVNCNCTITKKHGKKHQLITVQNFFNVYYKTWENASDLDKLIQRYMRDPTGEWIESLTQADIDAINIRFDIQTAYILYSKNYGISAFDFKTEDALVPIELKLSSFGDKNLFFNIEGMWKGTKPYSGYFGHLPEYEFCHDEKDVNYITDVVDYANYAVQGGHQNIAMELLEKIRSDIDNAYTSKKYKSSFITDSLRLLCHSAIRQGYLRVVSWCKDIGYIDATDSWNYYKKMANEHGYYHIDEEIKNGVSNAELDISHFPKKYKDIQYIYEYIRTLRRALRS